jgi:hypothetical protein
VRVRAEVERWRETIAEWAEGYHELDDLDLDEEDLDEEDLDEQDLDGENLDQGETGGAADRDA